jgi:hypothetical protein
MLAAAVQQRAPCLSIDPRIVVAVCNRALADGVPHCKSLASVGASAVVILTPSGRVSVQCVVMDSGRARASNVSARV